MAETNTSLMRKTKKELIDIILRKDDVEKRQQNLISDYEGSIKSLERKVETYDKVVEDKNKYLSELKKVKEEIVSLYKTLKIKEDIIETTANNLKVETDAHRKDNTFKNNKITELIHDKEYYEQMFINEHKEHLKTKIAGVVISAFSITTIIAIMMMCR